MQAGVGLHMWDVTMAQYNPGLGIVSYASSIPAWQFSMCVPFSANNNNS